MIKKIFILLILIILLNLIPQVVFAKSTLTGNQLLKLNGKIITDTTTIDQVNTMFGAPKIVTESPFGGNAYSYYDNEYTWYLHIETNEAGKILGYGAINGNFVSRRYTYGDAKINSYWYMCGTVLSYYKDNNVVFGVYEYNCTNNDINTYWKNYQSNSSKYLYGLQKHSAVVSKIAAKRYGYSFEQTAPSDDIFYINEQLKYNGSNLDEYAKNNGKDKSIVCVGTRSDYFSDDLPNPIRFGEQTIGYEYEGTKYVLYDLEVTDYDVSNYVRGYTRMYYITPRFLEEKKKIELTSDEKQKLQLAEEQNKIYLKYVNDFNNSDEPTYVQEPNWTKTPLVAGKINPKILYGVTAWLNIARAGLGINTLELDETIADEAQHKAVMVYYASSKKLPSGHYMSRPEGVSQEFYDIAQKDMNENLFTGDSQTSISYALNDGYGDAISCGHRYNLLYPTYTRWGTGTAGEGISFTTQSCHKFAGYKDCGSELVAWPSNGIFPIDLAYVGIGNWTAFFFDKYAVSSDTYVTINCLTMNETYEIKQNDPANGKILRITDSYLVTFRDDSIIYDDGDIFEITIHNVKDTSTGKTTNYTYRSIFKQFNYEDKVETTNISLNKTSMKIAEGQKARILAKALPESSTNKLMTFSSSNDGIVKVQQDGTIVGVKKGNAVITIKCGNVTKQVPVEVTDILLGDVTLDGKVNTDDARAVLLYYMKKQEFTEKQEAAADVTGDGKINTDDARQILLYYMKKITNF